MNLLARKFPTILGLVVLLAVVGGVLYYFRLNQSSVTQTIIPQKVTITNVTDTKFSVSWITGSATSGALVYGPVGEALATTVNDERDSTAQSGNYLTHQVTITGLQPMTQYAFRVVSGPKLSLFDNSGSPYTTTTGPVIGATPPSLNFYGTVQLPSKQSPDGAIVYVSLPGSAPASTLVHASGNYAVTVSTIRTSDLHSYVTYDNTTVATVTIQSGSQQSVASVTIANSAPVPVITLGSNADFRGTAETPAVAQVQPADSSSPSASSTPSPTTPGIFNVQPLAGSSDINAVTTNVVTILNPATAGETLATLQPEFRGTGTPGTTLSVAVTGQKAVSDTATIADDGTWTWSPAVALKLGKQLITLSYVDSNGKTQKVSQAFVIANSTTTVDPAFVSSPSASTKATAKPTATPLPQAGMPSTASGVPVTGVIEPTLLTAGASLVIMVLGAFLLAL